MPVAPMRVVDLSNVELACLRDDGQLLEGRIVVGCLCVDAHGSKVLCKVHLAALDEAVHRQEERFVEDALI